MKCLIRMHIFADLPLMPARDVRAAPCKNNHPFCFTLLLPRRKDSCAVSLTDIYYYEYKSLCQKLAMSDQITCATEIAASGERMINCTGEHNVCKDTELADCSFYVTLSGTNSIGLARDVRLRVPSSSTGNEC